MPSTSASTNRGSDTRFIVARASGAAAARGRVERRIGHLSVVERGLRRSAAARAWVLIAATWHGDGVSSALACGHALLGSGGGSIDCGVSADCAVDALLGGSCRARHLTAGAGFVRRRPRRRRRAWLALRGRESAVFQSGAFALVLRYTSRVARLLHTAVSGDGLYKAVLEPKFDLTLARMASERSLRTFVVWPPVVHLQRDDDATPTDGYVGNSSRFIEAYLGMDER